MLTIKKRRVIHPTLTGFNFEVDSPLRPLRAIREKCRECCCGNAASIRRCQMTDCPLWPLRFGRNPNRKGIGPTRGEIGSKTSSE